MSKLALRAGAFLVIAGAAVIAGFSLYYAFDALFAESSVPLAIRIAVPAIGLGAILLLAAVGWERYRKAREERFEEIEK